MTDHAPPNIAANSSTHHLTTPGRLATPAKLFGITGDCLHTSQLRATTSDAREFAVYGCLWFCRCGGACAFEYLAADCYKVLLAKARVWGVCVCVCIVRLWLFVTCWMCGRFCVCMMCGWLLPHCWSLVARRPHYIAACLRVVCCLSLEF